MQPGTLVRHRTRPEWGLGVVTAHPPDGKVAVAFEGRDAVQLDPRIAAEKLEVVDPSAVDARSPLRDAARWAELALPPDRRPLAAADASDLPRVIMREVRWSFFRPRIESYAEFCAEVAAYDAKLSGDREQNPNEEPAWQPDALAIPRAHVQVQYICWRGQRQVEPRVKLATRDGGPFTVGELLWKTHNAVRHDLHDMDHHFFEGFDYLAPGTLADGPVYSIALGS